MERREPFHSRRENDPTPKDITELVAMAFLRSRYQISEEGQALQRYVRQTLLIGDIHEKNQRLVRIKPELPTVENPHLELFSDLEISDEDKPRIFGFDLDLVTITQGCTHGCSHCTVNAKKLAPENIMPFPAILKIADQKKRFEASAHQSWQQWYEDTATERGEYENIRGKRDPAQTRVAKEKLRSILEGKYLQHEIRRWLPTFGPVVVQSPDVMRSIYLTYDGEPSDYRDETFLHENGTPTNWGDVFSTLSTPLRPVSFSTAGWPETDLVAQAGAEVVASLLKRDTRLKEMLAISLNPYDRYYKKDPAAYRAAMEKIIRLFGQLHPTILVRSEQTDAEFERFFQDVYTPLIFMYLDEFVHDQAELSAMQKSLRETQIRFGKTSHYSGRAFQPGHEDDPDTLIASAGIHLWPNGTVAVKEHDEFAKMFNPSRGVKGGRPKATTQNIFSLNS